MRRFLPPRSDARCASPSLPQGAKNSRARLSPAGSRLGPGRLQRAAVPLPVRGKGRGLDGHALGIRIPPPPVRGMPARTAFFCSSIGSPPRMRGKSSLPPDGNLSLRSTPAHAGNCPVLRNPGRNAAPRITPAHAGKSCRWSGSSASHRDHPRACGEKARVMTYGVPSVGSPPRMREKVEDKVREYKAQRITPAYAGKSATTTWARTVGRDHPRVCGEKPNRRESVCIT